MIIKFYKDGKIEQECKPLFSFFPDGQPHVKVEPLTWKGFDKVEIHCSIRNPLELFQFRMVRDICGLHDEVHSYIYWLFGARMDRRIDNDQPATFQLVCNSLFPVEFWEEQTHLLDIHNPGAVPEIEEISLEPILQAVLADFGDCDIYFPDKGAQDRYKNLFLGYNILCGKKKRDSQTGKLSGFELESGERLNERILIYDDLCDGGGTFVGQFSVLKDLGYKDIGLAVTHGLFTKGIGVLKDFSAIYYTNSFTFGLPVVKGYPTNNRLCLNKCIYVFDEKVPRITKLTSF